MRALCWFCQAEETERKYQQIMINAATERVLVPIPRCDKCINAFKFQLRGTLFLVGAVPLLLVFVFKYYGLPIFGGTRSFPDKTPWQTFGNRIIIILIMGVVIAIFKFLVFKHSGLKNFHAATHPLVKELESKGYRCYGGSAT